MKSISKIQDRQLQAEIHGQVKNEYEKYRNVEDVEVLEYLLVTGRKQLKMLESYIPQ